MFERGLKSCVCIWRRGAIGVAFLQKGVERRKPGRIVVPHALHVDAQDALQRRQPVALRLRFENLVGLLLIPGHGDPRGAVLRDVLEFRPGIGRIDADGHRANHFRAEIRIEPFWCVFAGDDDPVAALNSGRRERQGKAPRLSEIMRPVVAAPDAKILFAQRPCVRLALCMRAKKPGQRHSACG